MMDDIKNPNLSSKLAADKITTAGNSFVYFQKGLST